MIYLFISFQVQVNETWYSGNLDTPEGGFDALMQATVCTVGNNLMQDGYKLFFNQMSQNHP